MSQPRLKGVIAAAATPITRAQEPDLDRFVALCKWLLDESCDALNICGTTGEATSFSVQQRMAVMSAAAERGVPLARLMVGTGAAAVADAVTLTKHAASLGFAGALLLPPFYYKGVSDDGIIAYFERIVTATRDKPVPLYLYNFPALSGVEYTPVLVRRLIETFGDRMRGLKDSSGNMDYAKAVAAISPSFDVFPSTEAVLLDARAGKFAGCISASANVNSALCGRAFRDGDKAALETAVKIRGLVSRQPLIPSIKAVLADLRRDPAFDALMPPLSPLPKAEKEQLLRDYRAARG